MRRVLALFLMLSQPAWAQEDDRGFLEAFLEDNLSGAGREVSITGFQGALSSRASIESLTIADGDGIWITLNGITLDWSRSSLLSGEVVVNELSAEEIIVARAPDAGEKATPAPEARGFSLPELPVSIEIGRVAAERIVLERQLLGQAVEGSLEASLSLVDGEGRASLALRRNDDGPDGQVTLDATYSNANRQLDISLDAAEAANGIAATLLSLPGLPSTELFVVGSGPFDDFNAVLRLATDGIERLDGSVTVRAAADLGHQFNADLSGDLAPLFLPQYAEFFGPKVTLVAAGSRSPVGGIDLRTFALTTQSLAIEGRAKFAADGLPERFSLTGKLAAPDGTPVLLPVGSRPTLVREATLAIEFSQPEDEEWVASFDMQGLDHPDFSADRLLVDGSGRIGRTGVGRSFGATVKFAATGMRPADKGIAAALGPEAAGRLVAHWLEGDGALSVPEVRIDGQDYSGRARLTIEGLRDAWLARGRVQVEAGDLSRFSQLAGRSLGGSGRAVIDGSASWLSGFFDLVADVEGTGLSIGVSELDRLLAEQSRVQASVRRDETGTTLRSFNLTAGSLKMTGSGTLSSRASDLEAKLVISDLGALGPGFRGEAEFDARFQGAASDGRLVIEGAGVGLGIGQPQVDRLLAGRSTVRTTLSLADGEFRIDDARISNPQVDLTASGRFVGAARQIDLSAKLANLAVLVPEFPGELRLEGRAEEDGAGYRLDLRGSGPGQVDATVSGRLAKSLDTADLTISGTGQAALANVLIDPRAISGPVRFDLRLDGPLRPASLSGQVSLSGGRITDPGRGFAFERTEAILDLSAGIARVSATTEPSTGGRIRVDGTVGLQAPNVADLDVNLQSVRLVDPELFQANADGALRIEGPLTGGALISGNVDLAEAEIRVPSSGFGGAAGLPSLRHRNEPAEVLETRRKAGLVAGAGGRDGGGVAAGDFRLDIEVSAPNRVFVRGRGIEAELGGAVTLRGTTRAVVPSGGLTLVRGRLDILGRRLVLTEASLTVLGDIIPEISISASTESDGILSLVTISGPANRPDVTFTSVPELPQEEVLSRLLFGRGLDTITPLQAAQLANAVAVLAGRGGDGVIGRLRQGFGLDDLDLTTADDGSTAVRVGKYISENVYTEIEVDQEGRSKINLNLDVRPGVTAKGRVAADGDTGIGVFLERDY